MLDVLIRTMTKPAIAGASMLMARPMTITLPLSVTPMNEKIRPSAKLASTARAHARMRLPVKKPTSVETNAPMSIIPSRAMLRTFALKANTPPMTHRMMGALW